MILLLILATGTVLYLEVPGLIKKKYWRELIIFSLLMAAGFTLFLLLIIDVNIPSPFLFIEEIVNNLKSMYNFKTFLFNKYINLVK